MLSVGRMPVIQLTAVDYRSWREGRGEIPGAGEEVICLLRQPPSWEAVDTLDLDSAPLAARLVHVNQQRSDVQTMYSWSRRMGVHPVVFCEAAAIMQKMIASGCPLDLVCLGSLWLVDGKFYYAGWQNGKACLHPFHCPLPQDSLCPVVSLFRPLKRLPEM